MMSGWFKPSAAALEAKVAANNAQINTAVVAIQRQLDPLEADVAALQTKIKSKKAKGLKITDAEVSELRRLTAQTQSLVAKRDALNATKTTVGGVHTHILASESTRDGMRLANTMATTHVEVDTAEITQNMDNVARIMKKADKTFTRINKTASKSRGEATLSELLGEDEYEGGGDESLAGEDEDDDEDEDEDEEEAPPVRTPSSAIRTRAPALAVPPATPQPTGRIPVDEWMAASPSGSSNAAPQRRHY